jgi:flagellar biosynthesis anti-sigma factor FlgM
MKINANSVNALNAELRQKELNRVKQSEEDTANISSGDSVELSSRAMDLKEMQTKAMSTSDVRSEKVEAVKIQVENGAYSIDNRQIAEKLLDEALGM